MTEKIPFRALDYSGELLPIILLEEALEKYAVSALRGAELEKIPWWTPEKIAARTRELHMTRWSSCRVRSFPIETVDLPFPTENAKYGHGYPLDTTQERIRARRRVEVHVSHGTGSTVLVCSLLQYGVQSFADDWLWYRWLPEKVFLVQQEYRRKDRYLHFPVTFSSEERIKNHEGWYAYLGEPVEATFDDLGVDETEEDEEAATV